MIFKDKEQIKRDEIFEKYHPQFDELNEQFNKSNKFIIFILFIVCIWKNFPFKQYEEDKNNNVINFSTCTKELIKYLRRKYGPKKHKFIFIIITLNIDIYIQNN
jgi:hypothetical protein